MQRPRCTNKTFSPDFSAIRQHVFPQDWLLLSGTGDRSSSYLATTSRLFVVVFSSCPEAPFSRSKVLRLMQRIAHSGGLHPRLQLRDFGLSVFDRVVSTSHISLLGPSKQNGVELKL